MNLDPTAAERKKDHIELAFQAQVASGALDGRFFYEPMLAPHPSAGSFPTTDFLGKKMRLPIWVSSMTGGTELARRINQNLAQAVGEFGLGMGLGSCRQLLFSDDFFGDFDVRNLLGDQPFFANLGVAQVEQLLEKNEIWRVEKMLEKLRADGLIIHVNPLQEAMQPEGDAFKWPPIETIRLFLAKTQGKIAVIVKEVGQGFGPASLAELLKLPLAAIDFAAAGGTNFSKLELLRAEPERKNVFEKMTAVGHSALEMLAFLEAEKEKLGDHCLVKNVIVSGGVADFLDGFFYVKKAHIPAVYGQASKLLLHAQGDYEQLKKYIEAQKRGLELAEAFLRPVF